MYVVQARDDKAEAWNDIIANYFGLIGVGGYGGYEGYVKVRGIYRGAVFVRWNTNMILLVGAYSPYMDDVDQMPNNLDGTLHHLRLPVISSYLCSTLCYRPHILIVLFRRLFIILWNVYVFVLGIDITYAGCFVDGTNPRDLPIHMKHYTAATVTPRTCLLSCLHTGYKYAAIQNGGECWCGNKYGVHGAADRGECDMSCPAFEGATIRAPKRKSNAAEPTACGGSFRNSIYWNAKDAKFHEKAIAPPADATYVEAAGRSCSQACAENTETEHRQCDAEYFSLISRSCEAISNIVGGCKKGCHEDEKIETGIFTPYRNLHTTHLKFRLSCFKCYQCLYRSFGAVSHIITHLKPFPI